MKRKRGALASMTVAGLALAALLAGCALLRGERGGSHALLFDDLGDHHHPVTTDSPRAQRYFDQGLTLVFAFNHDEATRSFREAARLDPRCAMAWWGIAYAAGPNYNSPIDPERELRAFEAIQRALALAEGASPRERDYIEALALRHDGEPGGDRTPLDRAYADAMREVVKRHPGDLDAATLFAEALMDLRPWQLWSADGKPAPETPEILETLESVLARDPEHPGANHYYIHAVEASRQPERALPSAERLATRVPGAGHLVHMPAHVYMRIGKYDEAVRANERAIEVDRAYLERARPSGLYPMMVVPHNADFLWAAASMEGRSALALAAAGEVAAAAPPEMIRGMPGMEAFAAAPLYVMARFGRWEEILAEPAPPDDLRFWSAIRHYARGLALARTGRHAEAAKEQQALDAIAKALPPEQLVGPFQSARSVLQLASRGLAGERAASRGRTREAVAALREAVKLQDALRYMEPPPWYYPVRQSLGAVLLQAGRPKEAEAVFREDLRRHPENGWSLFGLAQSLRRQRRSKEASAVEARFEKAWARADVKLEAARF